MKYTHVELEDKKTPLNKALLGPMQGAIEYALDKLGAAIFAVLTPEDMDEILTHATDENVGVSYMYLGETTTSTLTGETYKKGAVYTVEKEVL